MTDNYPENEANHIEFSHRGMTKKVAPIPPAARPLKDDGTRIKFADGAVRSGHKGQGRFDLLPFRALARVAIIFEKGAEKYAPDNWLKGMPLRQFADSAFNHYRKAMQGMVDEDHWAMAAWNILAIVEYQERMREGIMDTKWDDLPKAIQPSPFVMGGDAGECRDHGD